MIINPTIETLIRTFAIPQTLLGRIRDEKNYMPLPDALEKFEKVNRDKDCLVLNKAIYGLIQAARQFLKKLKKVLV